MSPFAEELLANSEELVDRWYTAWRASDHPRPELDETFLREALASQLRIIGEQMRDLPSAETPSRMWTIASRLDPESRVGAMPIEEVVQGYAIAVRVVRQWIEDRGIRVDFEEFSYFYESIFELLAEAARRYSKHQAEVTSRARAQYLASAMHQLRQPIFVARLLLDRGEREGTPPSEISLDALRRQIRRMSWLAEGLLRLERYEPGELPVRSQADLEVAPVISWILEDHHADALEKGIELAARVSPELRMTFDPDLFTDALGNLIQNAVKYTSAGHVHVTAQELEDEVRFRVEDSGPGIPEARLKDLLRKVQPGAMGGAGLGLMIAERAARAQGGRIEIQSAPGRGSTFTLCLPRHVPPRAG